MTVASEIESLLHSYLPNLEEELREYIVALAVEEGSEFDESLVVSLLQDACEAQGVDSVEVAKDIQERTVRPAIAEEPKLLGTGTSLEAIMDRENAMTEGGKAGLCSCCGKAKRLCNNSAMLAPLAASNRREQVVEHNTPEPTVADLVREARTTTDMETVITLTHHASPTVRKAALKEMCPCRVKADHDRFWDRVIQMTGDPDLEVRKQVLHTLGDGSPTHRETDIIRAVETFNSEPDVPTRRRAHKVLAAYRSSGKWNIL